MQGDNFDRELGAALARYAAVEPRQGFEERVLANLRSEQPRATTPGWRRWSVAVACAAVALLASIAFWHGSKTTLVERVARASAHSEGLRAVSRSATDGNNPMSQNGSLQVRQKHRGGAVAGRTPIEDAPELEQFPAPEPMTAQEELLMRFVQEDPKDAELVAEARTEQTRREEEEIWALPSSSGTDQQEP
jgi:hypothetical protein